MKKILFAIFAHPDDEAFGPSGTLLSETLAGSELHLILLTDGGSGTNPDNHSNLGDVRLEEWRQAGALMGAQGFHYLGYQDGELTNKMMLEIAQRTIELMSTIVEAAPHDTQIEVISNDLNGITGHIDHIVAARAACLAFYKMQQRDARFQRLRLACLTSQDLPTDNTHWLYMEAGHNEDTITETVDNRHLRNEIIAIIHTHHTQRGDGEYHITQRGDRLGVDHFIVKT